MFVQISCIFGLKNLPKTLPKRGPNPSEIEPKNVLFFNIDFSGFGLDFGASWASKIRRAACSARRVRPYSMDMCLEPPCMEILGGGKTFQILGQTWPCWGYVGTFFALGRFFFALGRFWNASWTFLAHLGRFFRFFGRSGLHFAGSRAGFGAFKPTFFDFFWC